MIISNPKILTGSLNFIIFSFVAWLFNSLPHSSIYFISILLYTHRVSEIDVYTLWNFISQQRKETEIQFSLSMIQKALEKHSNTFTILHVFKQTWQWNYHSMNVSGYSNEWSGESWCSSTPLEGWIWYTTINSNN